MKSSPVRLRSGPLRFCLILRSKGGDKEEIKRFLQTVFIIKIENFTKASFGQTLDICDKRVRQFSDVRC